MSTHHDPAKSAESHAEIAAAQSALARGDLQAAQHHLDLAVQHGASVRQTQQLSASIRRAEVTQQKSSNSGGWRGFWVAILGYLCLSLQQPLGWGIPLWIFLAFLLVPSLAGLAVGLSQRAVGTPGRSFWTAFKSVGKAIALYTIIHLLLIGGPHSDSADRWQERIAGVLSTVLYALIAGLVAGTVSMTVGSVRVKERLQ